MDECLSRKHGMHRAVGAPVVPTLLVLLLFASPASTAVPYTPSQLFYSSTSNGSFAYLLQSTGTSQDASTEFITWDISGDIDTTSPSYNILMDPLPFQLDSQSPAFVPVIDQHGVIKMYVGDCQKALDQGELWQFTPDNNSSIGDGAWEKLSVKESESSDSVDAPNYLSAGFAYASTNTSDSSVYAFGGMCPFSNASETNWMGGANYSQSMVVLEPSGSRRTDAYDASTTGNRAPPIAEAGFTVTPLQATYAYSSSGEVRQQQDFLLIGGQTQDAFINMSQLAVFSLPQNSWSFVTVDITSASYKTELAVRDVATVEPRSGHTAVLSPDGSKVIVYGGWVGNTSIAAQPQLVILELGETYGGAGDWTWRVLSTGDTETTGGSGLYGHGAAMLPGDVMMRSAKQSQPNSQVYLYNITSEEWVSTYRNPDSIASQQDSSHSGSSKTWKTGVGVGVGLGIPVIAGLAILLFFLWKRRQKRRVRDKELRKLALGAERAHFWGQGEPFMASSIHKPSMKETEGRSDYPWMGNSGSGRPFSWQDTGDAVAESTGLLGDPSPTTTGRSSLSARMYRPPTQYSEYRRSDATGDIHPIDEREEDEAKDAVGGPMQKTIDNFRAESTILTPLSTTVCGDSYAGGSAGPSDYMAGVGYDRDIPSSSDKDERTSSNLSDSSTSAKSISQPRMANFSYPASQPSSGRQSPQKSVTISIPSREPARSRPNSAALSFEKRYSSDSYSTAQTSLSLRQAEGEHLLRDNPEPTSPLDLFPKPTTFPKQRTSEWIGNNVRRVLSLTRRRPATDSDPTTAPLASGIDRRSTVLGPNSTATGYGLPRRSVSASAELFKRKQGAKDWGAANRLSRNMESQARSTRDDTTLGAYLDLDPDSDDDWDVEGAAEGRRVQVTFTVPKEKLRVVNATAGELDTFSEKSVSRSNSDAAK
ncbi:Arabinogalactan endo-beta-1, 4-galactanase A domain protein [Aspergillus niger]|uniref:Arabinogalactan endo-beta-1, 4-galactanase A domain protein n=1 Tax=Aspergillus niger TaxID=5061 RepID=A0A505HLS8_ASPNG|nr:Arabinogalactan endo-beta-1, 4-galactanase A domain protein [Aspergillus niger]